MSRVLLVEDMEVTRKSLAKRLTDASHEVTQAGSVAEARKLLSNGFDLILTDLIMPGASGLELIPLAAPVPIIVMTAYGSIEGAVHAMRLGAEDYIEKSVSIHDELVPRLEPYLARRLSSGPRASRSARALIGETPAMGKLREKIEKVASKQSANARVLILGETGTGKELVARAVHELSARSGKPFVAINCAAMPQQLVESMLFGHCKGSFSGADTDQLGVFREADEGTLFLDEVGELSLDAQVKLLRVLQDGVVRPVGGKDVPVDVRVVAATERDLESEIATGRFRRSLYERLNTLPIHTPPLRARVSDIPLLAEHFLRRFADEEHEPVRTLAPDAVRALQAHPWPGNVRELENVIRNAVADCNGDPIGAELLNLRSARKALDTPKGRCAEEEEQHLRQYYKTRSQRTLARDLGRNVAWINKRLKELGLSKPSSEEE